MTAKTERRLHLSRASYDRLVEARRAVRKARYELSKSKDNLRRVMDEIARDEGTYIDLTDEATE